MSAPSYLAPRPPGRVITERFWSWLQEQFEKIVVILHGKVQLFHADLVQVGNPAIAGAQVLKTAVIPIGTFDFNGIDEIIIRIFGRTAANGNNKTLDLQLNGVSISSRVTTANNLAWVIESHFFILTANTQKVLSHMTFENGSTDMEISAPTIDLNAVPVTITFEATSSVPAANDVLVDGFTVAVARMERS